jgi:putative phosphoesterase
MVPPSDTLRISVLSDTHGFLHPEIPSLVTGSNEIWHLGDVGDSSILDRLGDIATLRVVYGNADGQDVRYQSSASLRFRAGDMDVLMVHDAGLPSSGYNAAVRALLEQDGRPDILACGHTHITRVERDASGMLYVNPGACGRYGPQRVKTILRFTIAGSSITNFEVVELDTRPSERTDALTVAEFARRSGRTVSPKDLNAIGRAASRISQERGWPILKEEHPRFGSVNVYLKEALEIALREVLG